MPPQHFHGLVDLKAFGWTPGRIAAAAAVAGPNDERIAQAALQRLDPNDPTDHTAGFGRWCDAHTAADEERS